MDATYNAVATTWLGRYQHQPDFQARLFDVGTAVLHELGGERRHVVLDFGGGAGVISAVASSRAARVVCLDRSWRMLRQAHLEAGLLADLTGQMEATYRPERVFRVAGDISSLSSKAEGSFDLVIAVAVVEYMRDVDATVVSLERVMAIDGHLLFTVPNPRSVMRIWYQLQRRSFEFVARRGPRLRSGFLDYEALRPHGSAVPWSAALQNAQLEVLSVKKLARRLSGFRRLIKPNLLVIAGRRA